MNYLLLLFVLIIHQNEAKNEVDENKENRRNTNESFDVNISAGYGVGIEDSKSDLPKSTTKINHTQNYLTTVLSKETIPNIRGARILTNFTPSAINILKVENVKNDLDNSESFNVNKFVPQTKYEKGSSFQNNQLPKHFPVNNSPITLQPNIRDLQKFINDMEIINPYSKIEQVIKVPAVYEIHMKPDMHKISSVTLNTELFNPKETTNWSNYLQNKILISNASTRFSDDYINWLNNYYKQREDKFFQKNKHSEYNTETSVEPITLLNNHVDILEPILTHHYQNANNLQNDENILINYNTDWVNPYYGTSQSLQKNSYIQSTALPQSTNRFNKNNNHNSQIINTASLIKNQPATDFKHKQKNFSNHHHYKSQEITETNKPSALYVVPAPYLGKYPRPSPFKSPSETQVTAYSTHALKSTYNIQQSTVKPSNYPNIVHTNPSTVQNTLPNVYSTLIQNAQTNTNTGNVLHSSTSVGKTIKGPHLISANNNFDVNKNQNLIYGKRTTEAVLSPLKINPATMAQVKSNFIANREDSFHKNNSIEKLKSPKFRYKSVSQEPEPNLNQLQKQEPKSTTFNYENIHLTTDIPEVYEKIRSKYNQKSFKFYDSLDDEGYKDYEYGSNKRQNRFWNPATNFQQNQLAFPDPQNNFPHENRNIEIGNKFRQSYYTSSEGHHPPSRTPEWKSNEHLGYVIYINEKSLDDAK